MNGVVVLVAVIATLLAVAFFLSARTARAALKVRDEELGRTRAAEEAAKKSAAESKAEAKERREEVSALRAELGGVRKKAFEQAETAKRAGGALALREEIDKLGARLAEARAEAEAHGSRVKTLEKELERANAAAEKLRVLRQAQDERAERPAPRQMESASAPVTAAAAPAGPAGLDEAALKLERDRADKAEAKLAETRKKVAELEAAVKNVRGRLETEKRVYMVQKSELELANDRYGELRRRHDGLRKDHDELIEAVRQAAREEQRTAAPPVPAVSADEKLPS
jgi:colicin import membrane protein